MLFKLTLLLYVLLYVWDYVFALNFVLKIFFFKGVNPAHFSDLRSRIGSACLDLKAHDQTPRPQYCIKSCLRCVGYTGVL